MPLIRRVPEARVHQHLQDRVRGGEPVAARRARRRDRPRRAASSAVWPGAASRSRSSATARSRARSRSRPTSSAASAREKIEAAGGSCRSSQRDRELPQHLRDPGPAQAAGVHVRPARGVPARLLHPDAGHRSAGADRVHGLAQGHRARLRQHLHRRQPRAGRGVRARDHAVHHGVDHPAAADGGGALPREAVEGRRARAARRSPSTPATARW